MSILNAFDNTTEAVINPWQIISPAEGFPKIVVAAFGERFITALQDHYAPVQIDALTFVMTIPIYKINYKGMDMAVCCCPLGGPAASGLLEEMIAKGGEKFLFFGSCGVLDREIAAKSLIVPTAAYRDEGTSYHYAPPGDYMPVPTAEKLAGVIREMGLPCATGRTWTTDAFYRETRGKMEKRKSEGCITVEMECASIMAAAQFRGADAYQFLYAADSLYAAEWDARTLGGLSQDARENFLRIALEIAARV